MGGKNETIVAMPASAGATLVTPSPKRFSQRRICYILLAIIAVFSIFRLPFLSFGGHHTTHHQREEVLPIFDEHFKQKVGEVSIDEIHKRGLPHFGTIVVLYRRVEGTKRVEFLLSKRSKQTTVCVGSWSFLSEHGVENEGATAMVLRALRDEAGLFLSEEKVEHICDTHVLHDFDGEDRSENQYTHIAMAEYPNYQDLDFNHESDGGKWVSPTKLMVDVDKGVICNYELSKLVGEITLAICKSLSKKGLDCEVNASTYHKLLPICEKD
eukprot:m.118316 g.118316  ORF g.118316 m.118316 type:complete len:269 (+) comp9340_c1_seq1:16-822(+)